MVKENERLEGRVGELATENQGLVDRLEALERARVEESEM